MSRLIVDADEREDVGHGDDSAFEQFVEVVEDDVAVVAADGDDTAKAVVDTLVEKEEERRREGALSMWVVREE